ncbi:MAG: hypothetical protein GC181_05130 [Bacteroidetes bacterium]|nr:hypothetical protein [Bacteroidota bacterium]
MSAKKFCFLLLSLVLFASGCKDRPDELQDTIYSAEDNAQAETHFFSAFDVIYDVVSTDGKLMKAESTLLPSGATVTYEDTTFSDGDGISLIVDFGELGDKVPKGILCQDGRYRAGKIHITAETKFIDPKFKVDVRIDLADNYFTGNGSEMFQLIGKTTITRSGLTAIKVDMTDATLLTGDFSLTWESHRIIELVSDNGPGIWGDIYQVTGEAKGKNRFGEEYSVEITEPLIKKLELGCALTFVKGELTVTSTQDSDHIIKINYNPYDDEACDLFAEADIRGRKTIFRVK